MVVVVVVVEVIQLRFHQFWLYHILSSFLSSEWIDTHWEFTPSIERSSQLPSPSISLNSIAWYGIKAGRCNTTTNVSSDVGVHTEARPEWYRKNKNNILTYICTLLIFETAKTSLYIHTSGIRKQVIPSPTLVQTNIGLVYRWMRHINTKYQQTSQVIIWVDRY